MKKSETGKEDEAGKNTGQKEQGKKQDETEEKKTNKQTNKEKKSKAKEKTSSGETKAKTKPTEEDDAEKIQRLIREQTEEQADRRRKRKNEHVGGRMDERMLHKLQMRLREIDDVDRLRRELRKIRTKEMTEDDYTEVEPWERDMDSRIPDEVRRDMRRRRFERMDDPDDLRRELRTRIIDLEDDEIGGHFLGQNSFVFRELRQRYMTEAEEIRDASELKKRIDDLDALSTILHGRRNRKRWRDRPRHHYSDEL